MLKAVFRPNELVTVTNRIVIDPPTSFSDLAHLAQVEENVETLKDIEEYTGPTADDLRREAEMFKAEWEEEKKTMIEHALSESDQIIQKAQAAALGERKKFEDEAYEIKQQAQEEAQRIIAEARIQAAEIEKEVRQTLEGERKEALEKGREEGREEGYADGKAEVERLIERTQVVLERAQNKRGEILSETEKEIVDLVLLISRKVIKVISENQRNVIISNAVQALRKVKTKGNVIIRVNMADLKLATEHKEEFIRLMEGANIVQVVEDTTVDPGGCIIETDFGEIDARISSQLAELESKILEISPIRSSIKENTPPPVIRVANLNTDLAAASAMINVADEAEKAETAFQAQDDDEKMSIANSALTASAALAALATLGMKGKRSSDKELLNRISNLNKPAPA